MKKQSGFTLIEIVMVLVLLGILSAVAVPKYFDLQTEAQEKAAAAIAAEFQSQMNAAFAAQILKANAACSAAVTAAVDTAKGMGISDPAWTISYTKPTLTVKKGDATVKTFTIVEPDCAGNGGSAG